MGPSKDSHGHQTVDVPAVRAAEAELLAAREQWHREHGPAPQEQAPEKIRRAERAFIEARELWQQDQQAKASRKGGQR